MEVNELIKKRRKELGLTLEDVAEALGVAKSTVLRYETKDINNMGIDKVEALSRVLDCSPSYLMGWTDEYDSWIGANSTPEEDFGNRVEEDRAPYYVDREAKELAQEIYENREFKILFDASRKLTKDDINAVIDIVKRMKGNS